MGRSSNVESDVLRLSTRAARVNASAILSLMSRAKALQASGRDLVLFGAGEPDFPTPEHVRRATVDALERGATKYTQTAGIPELRAAIASTTSARLGVPYSAEQVIVTTGAKMALYELFQAIVEPGDEVILFGPYWASYPEMVALAGGVPVIVPTRGEDGFRPDVAALRRAVTPRTRAILLNSPSNPTGACFDRRTLEAIADVLSGTDALVVSDDIYDRILFDGRPFATMAQLGPAWRARTVIVNGVSKAYSMTGYRIGWALGPPSVIAAMGRLQDQSTSGPTSIAQYGALAAVAGPQEVVEQMRAAFERRRNLLHDGLVAIPGLTGHRPEGAFYAFVDVRGVMGRGDGRPADDGAFASWLLDAHDVVVIPGASFGAPGHVRLSFATSEGEIQRGLQRIAKAVASLA